MAKFSGGGRATIAATDLLPAMSLYAIAGVRLHLLEVHVSNTTAVAHVVALQHLTTTGTQGTGITEVRQDPESPANNGLMFNGHTAGPTITAGELDRITLPAAVGGAVVFVLDSVWIPAGTVNGVGVVTPTGTGQLDDIVFIWEE